ncbi:MAG: beta-ketoacyl synthase N-terminal-like domain-containing protein [Myxococcota bacterium]|nr:beta-ketoacyl synthase N-terminal-like domain-containing protein [Myxococcota bacterium]
MGGSSHAEVAAPAQIAIIGMSCLFPGAPDLERYWRLILSGECALAPLDERRLPSRYFAAESPAGRHGHRIGGALSEPLSFDPLRYGVMPVAAAGAEPDQLLTLQLAAAALEDAGYHRRPLNRDRAAVILGRGGYIGPAMSRLNQRVRGSEELLSALDKTSSLTSTQRAQLREAILQPLPPYGPDSAIGLVPNLCAARVAQRLDLRGPAYTVDGACASALIALSQGCMLLRSGEADLALFGGVHIGHDPTFWDVFLSLGALSERGQLSPFDQAADGILIGEGAGLLLLKRAAAARADGDRIYALIDAVALSGDGRQASLMSPSSEGQHAALARAWAHPLAPVTSHPGLLEAHGTGTPAGDLAELETLTAAFGRLGESTAQIPIASVKAQIGHTMPAAGAAGLIKAALCLYHELQPATVGCETPHPQLLESRFAPLDAPRRWPENLPPIAAVNAFGFGGINGHAILSAEAANRGSGEPVARSLPAAQRHRELSLLLIAASNEETLIEAIETLIAAGESALFAASRDRSLGEGPARVAIIDPDLARLESARALIQKGRSRQGRGGVWYLAPEKRETLSTGKVAFLFPGVEASFHPDLGSIAARLGRPAPAPPVVGEDPKRTLETHGLSVIQHNLFLDELIRTCGLQPDELAGHSIGEWSGLISAGYLSREALAPFIQSLQPGSLEVPEVLFLAVGASLDRSRALLGPLSEALACSHENCPHQVIFCGAEREVEAARERLTAAGVIAQVLPFRSGFHAPVFAPFVAPLRAHLERLALQPPSTRLWSATTCEPYPEEVEALADLSGRHLVETVRFGPLIERLYQEGVRSFIQVGLGSLVSFTSDTLRGRPHLALELQSERRDGWSQLRRCLAALHVTGRSLDLGPLESVTASGPSPVKLDLSVPALELPETWQQSQRIALTATERAVPATKDRGADAAPENKPASDKKESPKSTADIKQREGSTLTLSLSLDRLPTLIDHCFFRQPEGWPRVKARAPVVPMTLSLEWIRSYGAQRLAAPVVHVTKLRAKRWIELEPPQHLSLRSQQSESGALKVELGDHLSATLEAAAHWPAAPPISWGPLPGEGPVPIRAEEIYRDRWMFHGPAFYGIEALEGIGPTGIRGLLRATETPGALLDNAGQLFGLWVMLREVRDRVVMPIGIDRLTFYQPDPAPGAIVACSVWIDTLSAREVKGRLALWHSGRLWATIEGWRDWRFETNERLWALMRYPERNLYSEVLTPPWGPPREQGSLTLAEGVSAVASSREFLVGRCLSGAEHNHYDALPPRRQRDWLAGRIAAKDAARDWRWNRGSEALFPIEISVESGEGAPRLHWTELDQSAGDALPSLSLAHSGGGGLALAASGEVGVDLERIEDRPESWIRASFTEAEWVLIQAATTETEDESAQTLAAWLTRAWSAKEARAKASGEGLKHPKRWEIQRREGARFLIAERWIETRQRGSLVWAWSLTPAQV